ncbi:hypothetical protein [Polyangium jinanense]|uniref:Uncharacterized protein n=1 Tax=Polyangium jinanense TaxID=2829994 RepID=A0A9X3X9P3_9BACT|nr:hypothetical protein [Polyangium jinanense]MDC3960426.1 hypothetical protein [Polyangium jinanense]MDC3985330.1 hypothetical protein [Polyangium jinanense]
MRKYRHNVSSTVRFEYGVELAAGLSQFPETAAAANDIRTVNDALGAQQDKRRALRIPVVETRAALRFAEFGAERVIRSSLRAAEIEDGGRRGRICACLFPKGLRPVVIPMGKRQVKPLKELVERLQNAKLAGIDDYRAAWLPKLKAALSTLEAAVAAHLEALTAHDEAFKVELALRDAHHDAVDKVIGIVRAAFPRNRELQDVIFPVVEKSRKGASESDEEFDPEPTSAAPAQS